jgi:hypothetical protein
MTEKIKIMQLHQWIKDSTAGQREAVANLANTTTNNIYQIAGGHTGMSTDMAIKLEQAIKEITPERPVPRWDLLPEIWDKPKEKK